MATIVGSVERLGTIFDHQQVAFAGELQDGPHVQTSAHQVSHKDGAAGPSDRLAEAQQVRSQRGRIQIDGHGNETVMLNDPRDVGNRQRGDQHFTPNRPMQGLQQQIQPATNRKAHQRLGGS